MTDENKTPDWENIPDEKNAEESAKTDGSAFIVAVILGALGVLSFILAFFVFKIYGVIAAVACELCALFCLKKIKNADKRVFILKIVIYSLLAVFVLFFVGGIIWAATQGN